MRIDLRPDIASVKKRPDGGFDVKEFGQWVLMVDGVQWGYVGKKKGSPINLIRRVNENTRERLRKELGEIVGERGRVTVPPEIEIRDEDDELA